MSFTDSYSESYPSGTTQANELDTAITQGTKRALRERLGVDHDFRPDEGGAEVAITPTGNIGYHKKVTLTERSSDPSAVADAGVLYTKDDSGDTELYFRDDSGNIVQMTKDGVLNTNPLSIIALAYPVGSIYINANVSTNPATLLGFGTWTAFGAGKVMVGLDSGDTDFDTAEETGGEKTHTLTKAELPSDLIINSGAAQVTGSTGVTVGTNGGGGGAHNNLQPYIVVYMWKRTA